MLRSPGLDLQDDPDQMGREMGRSPFLFYAGDGPSFPCNERKERGEGLGTFFEFKAPFLDPPGIKEPLPEDPFKEERIDIAAADVVVAGGRGMQSKENFQILQALADELGGVVAGSRSAVEAGWIPVERQVGQTGKTIRPKIYIACGISGAIQHLVGMQDSDVIIAINRDRTAPIFEVATYGIEGDVHQVVPAITNRIREMRTQRKG